MKKKAAVLLVICLSMLTGGCERIIKVPVLNNETENQENTAYGELLQELGTAIFAQGFTTVNGEEAYTEEMVKESGMSDEAKLFLICKLNDKGKGDGNLEKSCQRVCGRRADQD